MIGDFIVEVLFDMVIEPVGAGIRYIIFRLRGKKVKYKDLINNDDEMKSIDNEIANRWTVMCSIVIGIVISVVIHFLY